MLHSFTVYLEFPAAESLLYINVEKATMHECQGTMQPMLALGLLLLLSLDGGVAVAAEDGQFAYQGFATANLTLDGVAAVTPNGLLLLTDTEYQTTGHAFHPAPLRFLDSSTTMTNSAAMAQSFSASFVFAIRSRYDGLTSYGLAFVVAPTSNLSAAESGRYLGLLNATNGTASDPILAVELDTIIRGGARI